MTRWQWVLVGAFAFITYSVFVALLASLLEPPAPMPTPTRTPAPTFTPTGAPRPTAIFMPTRPVTDTPTVSPSPMVTPTPNVRSHTVRVGETLSTIARAYGVSVEAILVLNPFLNPNVIEVGQELLIPPP